LRQVFSYRKAIEVNSRHVDAHFNLGVLFHTLEKVELAIPEYQTAIQLEPKHYDAYSNLGSAKHKMQDLDGAIDAYQKAIDILRAMDQQTVDQNQLSMLYYLLGTALSGLPDHRCQDGPCLEHAANKLRQSLQHNPENEEARHALSALVSDPNVTSASAKYIRSLFDEYAANFDNSLLKGLDYQAPELVFAAVDRLRVKGRVTQFGTVYDAGCGTGLCGPLFRNVSKTLIGVDLSEPMVEKARERGVYDELEAADITESLQRFNNKSDTENFRRLDLIIAADVFVYTGDMLGVVKAAAGALRRGGWFALTLERLEAPKAEADAAAAAEEEDANATRGVGHAVTEADLARGWKLQLSGRFAHTKEYVAALGQQHGFKMLEHEHIVPRKDNGVDIPGHLFVLELTR
jgi:predicted TPR repeat methyltransferase